MSSILMNIWLLRLTLTGSAQRFVFAIPLMTFCITDKIADRKCILVTTVTDKVTTLRAIGCWQAHQCTMGNGGGGTERSCGREEQLSALCQWGLVSHPAGSGHILTVTWWHLSQLTTSPRATHFLPIFRHTPTGTHVTLQWLERTVGFTLESQQLASAGTWTHRSV